MPDALTRWLLQGQDALERDDPAAAVTALARALRTAPANTSIALALANAHRLAGDALGAREVLYAAQRRAHEATAEDLHALGTALLEVGSPAEAHECFARVLQARPSDPAAHGALASAKRALGDAGRAWPQVQRALHLAPTHPALLLTAAQIRHDLGDSRGAHRWLDAAEAARPGHRATRMQRAYTLLRDGASAAGWEAFESRPLPVPSTRARAWHGESLLNGDIVVTAEQGVGDQFQFVRFVALLASRGATRPVVECQADAVGLFVANGLAAVARGQAPDTDWHVPLLSLPHRLGLGSNVEGRTVPYLRAAGASSAIAEREPRARPRLGLVWAGNPEYPGRTTRDLDAGLLPAITGFHGVEWISLQQGAEVPSAVPNLATLPPLRSWATTAATLARLDGLVTTDTGIAHLAGAMGVATWVMLQAAPDWRWGSTGATTPWYPTVRLLRQPRSGDWAAVVAELLGQLRTHPTIGGGPGVGCL
jgi:thioredoxin-like negative regulator of GroEL